MKVVSSVTKDGRTVAVEIDEEEMRFPKDGSGGPAYSIEKRHQQMMQKADALIVRYLYESEMVGAEYAKSRLYEISTRSVRVPT